MMGKVLLLSLATLLLTGCVSSYKIKENSSVSLLRVVDREVGFKHGLLVTACVEKREYKCPEIGYMSALGKTKTELNMPKIEPMPEDSYFEVKVMAGIKHYFTFTGKYSSLYEGAAATGSACLLYPEIKFEDNRIYEIEYITAKGGCFIEVNEIIAKGSTFSKKKVPYSLTN